MKTEYGVIVLCGVRKDWVPEGVDCAVMTLFLRRRSVPVEWGEATAGKAWRDRFNRLRAVVAHYSNGRSATVRIDANGKWRTTFGDVE